MCPSLQLLSPCWATGPRCPVTGGDTDRQTNKETTTLIKHAVMACLNPSNPLSVTELFKRGEAGSPLCDHSHLTDGRSWAPPPPSGTIMNV